MVRLEISQTWGRLALQQHPAQLEIRTSLPQVAVRQEPAQLRVSSEAVQVEIDLTKAHADMGLKPPELFQGEQADVGWIKSTEGIARWARNGDRMAQSLGTGANILAEMGKEAMAPAPEVNVDAVPKHPPEISFSGDIWVDFTDPQLEVTASTQAPQITYTPGTVQLEVDPRPEIEIEVVGRFIDIII